MKVVLELLQLNSNVRRVTIRHDVVIGRSGDCNLRISSPQVSRRHCFLRVDDNRVAVTDLESFNGTWLNGQKTVPGKRYFVEDGMQLAIGPVCFVARISAQEHDVRQSDDASTRLPRKPNYRQSSSSEDQPEADRSSHEQTSNKSSEIKAVGHGSESEEVVVLDDATLAVDGGVSVEAIEMVFGEGDLELIDDD
ncbi:MAG: FHA domain-containing protein [Fuerstiella sp.]|nr:FHA domain-containing protein [Fuerstiella sp.]